MRISVFVIILSGILVLQGCKVDNNVYKANKLNEEAATLVDAGKLNEAIPIYYQALSFGSVPDSIKSTYYINLANAYGGIGKNDSAKFFLKKAVDITPKGTCEYYTYKAQIFLMDSLTEKAINSLEKAHQLNKNYLLTNNLLGLIYIGSYGMDFYEPRKALSYNIKVNELINGSTIAKYTLAKNYYCLEMTEKFVPLFKEIYRDNPGNTEYLATIIMIEQELGNKKESDYYLNKMKELDLAKYQDLTDYPMEAGTHTLVWK